MNGNAQAAIQLIGGGQVLGVTSTGQVLGASLSCGLYLNDYIHPVRKSLNNPDEVKKLQTFLDVYLGLTIPITGTYDAATIAGVNQFQLQNNKSVLAPWVPYGLANDMTSTGYVYKTTRRWINMIVCPPLGLPMPQLP
jgi:peptidoglycan hydrolase-like protein with peptidoglycan-binding domain